MTFTRATLTSRLDFSPTTIFSSSEQAGENKIHYCTVSDEIYDHIFAPKEGGIKAYMTGQGQGIECGDYLILKEKSNGERYQVDKINYYSNPPDMWIALLKQVVNS
ncbi:MAG TPA: hypothetical protein DCL61_25945 [Cyanobacteria bacterium UBA12227]|nr:hypothetical protein [Cyanobacteria bacterium UBA12227]HAX88754.1 hypothetical protein [Cyanobacteria bacterium UBA11370]HBY75988.1 hypothetical protein [Cyanobacteria bacterium UBA11148]